MNMNYEKIIEENESITVGQLLDSISGIDRNATLSMAPLTFDRIKKRGDNLYCLEFNEACVKSSEIIEDKAGNKFRTITFQQIIREYPSSE